MLSKQSYNYVKTFINRLMKSQMKKSLKMLDWSLI